MKETKINGFNLDGKPAKSLQGRPTKLTHEVAKMIGEFIEAGMKADQISHLVGVKKRTYANWLTKARKLDSRGIYRFLGETIKDAEEKCELALVKSIKTRATQPYEDVITEVVELPDGKIRKKITRRTIPPDMSTAKWLLSRRFPERWADQTKVEHSGVIEGTTNNIVLKFKDPESLDEKISEHQELLGIPDPPEIDDSNTVDPLAK